MKLVTEKEIYSILWTWEPLVGKKALKGASKLISAFVNEKFKEKTSKSKKYDSNGVNSSWDHAGGCDERCGGCWY